MRASFRLNSYAMVLEKLLLLREARCSAPQLFILGLPRSGTTLIYQYIATRLRIAYFTNGVGRFPGAPCLATFVEHNIYGQYKSDFRSNYGKVKGHTAPREAGGFWNRFFDVNSYTGLGDLTEKEVYVLRTTIAYVSNIYGGVPFVNKNVKHLLRINAMSQIFTNSMFLIVERDLRDVALSVLRGRYENQPDPTKWWSVMPPNYTTLKSLAVWEQVAHQCLSLKAKMEEDLSLLPMVRVIRIHYEDFCKNPEHLILRLATYLNTEETENLPEESFQITHNRPHNREEIALIGYINKFKDEENGSS